MQTVAALPRILGSLFYYSPEREQTQTLFSQVDSLPELYSWQDKTHIAEICQQIALPENHDLTYQFSVLFEGQGKMPVPPWGAAYLDRENLLMSDSTIDYRQFLAANQLYFTSDINEPEDQFGLMLLALSLLLEQEKFSAAIELLEQHLLPWGFRYLDLLISNSVSDTYAKLGQIARLFLHELRSQFALTIAERELYL